MHRLLILCLLGACAAPLQPRERAVAQVFELLHSRSIDVASINRIFDGPVQPFETCALETNGPNSALLVPDHALGLHATDFTPSLLDARHAVEPRDIGEIVWFVVGDRALGLGIAAGPDHTAPIESIWIGTVSHVGPSAPTLRETRNR